MSTNPNYISLKKINNIALKIIDKFKMNETIFIRHEMEGGWRGFVRLPNAALVHFGRDLQQRSCYFGGHVRLNDGLAVQHRPPRRQFAAGHFHEQ